MARLPVPGEYPLLPHDIEAEEAYLSCCFLGFEIPWDARLNPTDFYRERNGWVLEAMMKAKAVDTILVAAELRRVGRLDAIGGWAYLAHLITAAATPFHAQYYAELVRDAAEQRRMIEEGLKQVQAGYEGKLAKGPPAVWELDEPRNPL